MAGDDPTRYRTKISRTNGNKKIRRTLPCILRNKGLWSQKLKKKSNRRSKEDIKQAIAKADQAPKTKVTDLMEIMYEKCPLQLS